MLYLASELNYLATRSVSGAPASFSHCFSCPDRLQLIPVILHCTLRGCLVVLAVKILVTHTAVLEKSREILL